MIPDYFEYERLLWHQTLLPRLQALGIGLSGNRVLDVGCGYGGMLAGVVESTRIESALGLDLDAEMIRVARGKAIPGCRFEEQSLFDLEGGPFETVFMRDVLEHILDPARAVRCALGLLADGGILFVSFTPFFSPFGGHQHNGSGVFSHLPWLQLPLPEAVFRRLIRARGNTYKTGDRLKSDIDSVLRTRLTLARFSRLMEAQPVEVLDHDRFLVRPDYRLTFGLPTVRLPKFLPTALAELLCTAEEWVFRKLGGSPKSG